MTVLSKFAHWAGPTETAGAVNPFTNQFGDVDDDNFNVETYGGTSKPAGVLYSQTNYTNNNLGGTTSGAVFDFDLDEIPVNSTIDSVKIDIEYSQFMIYPEDMDGTISWELVTSSGVLLASGSEDAQSLVDVAGYVASPTVDDFDFVHIGDTFTTKEGGGVFTQYDLGGARLKLVVENTSDDGADRSIGTYIDYIKMEVSYSAVKKIIDGYMDRKGRPPTTGVNAGVCKSYVAKLGPGTQDGIQWQWIMTTATQAAAIAAIRTDLDEAYALGLKVKFRIFNPPPASLNASAPAVSHNGSGTIPSSTTCEGQQFDPAGFTIPNVRYWHDVDFVTAYAALQTKLAEEFDSHPALGDVAFMGGCLEFAEPMVRHIGGEDGIDYKRAQYNTWVAAGSLNTTYIQSDLIALKALMDCHDVWQQTPQSLACNPHQGITLGTCGGLPKYTGNTDNDRTFELAEYWCNLLGPRAIIGNNSIRPVGPDADYPPMYAGLVAICEETGADMYFQTASSGNLNAFTNPTNPNYDPSRPTLDAVLDYTISRCIGYGARYVELPDNYKTTGVTLPPFP